MPDAPLTSPLTGPTARPTRRTPRARATRAVGVAATVGALLVVGAACSSTTEPPASSSTTVATPGATEAGSSFATIAALHQGVVDGGFECTLEYPGLRDDVTSNEVSICTIEDETAYLTIWGDPANLADFAASPDGSTGTVALGKNWSIAVTTPALATELAAALGGTAPSGAGAASSTTTTPNG